MNYGNMWGRATASIDKAIKGGVGTYARAGWRTGRKIGQAGAFTSRGQSWGVMHGVAGGAFGGALGAAKRVVSGTARMTGKIMASAAKHPTSFTLAGIAMAGAYGIGRGLYAAGRMTTPVPPTNRPLPPMTGPGYNVWAGGRGMSPSNLGATGDLSLALHKTRHR